MVKSLVEVNLHKLTSNKYLTFRDDFCSRVELLYNLYKSTNRINAKIDDIADNKKTAIAYLLIIYGQNGYNMIMNNHNVIDNNWREQLCYT